MDDSFDPNTYSETNELAKERNRAAADRTLLAWIRTSLALIGFGFGIDRIVDVLSNGKHSHGLTAAIGLSFMALGVFAIVSASTDYRRQMRLLSEPRYVYVTRPSTSAIVAIVLALIGAAAFVGIFLQATLNSNATGG